MLLVEQSGSAEAAARIVQLPPQVLLAETQPPPVPVHAEVPPAALKTGRVLVGTVVMDGPFAVWHQSSLRMREATSAEPLRSRVTYEDTECRVYMGARHRYTF